jgi:hypothetical protein
MIEATRLTNRTKLISHGTIEALFLFVIEHLGHIGVGVYSSRRCSFESMEDSMLMVDDVAI